MRGYRIEHGSSVQPDSGGIVARNMTVWKNGCTSSLYVELNSSENILVWDELQIICSK